MSLVEERKEERKEKRKEGREEATSVTPTSHKPSQKERITAFLAPQNFHWDASRSLFADNQGNVVRRADGLFHWTQYDIKGELRHQYWVGRKSLAQGIELPAELWHLIKNSPDESQLLLPTENGQLRAYHGAQLQRLIESGEITLYPAIYRLRLTEN